MQRSKAAVADTTLASTRSGLGTEIDAIVTVPVATRTSVEMGGAVFVPGPRLEDTGRDRNAFWAYAQGILNF